MSKIEKPSAIDDIEAILAKSDAITIARDARVSRGISLFWRACSVLEASAADYDSIVLTAKEECQKPLSPQIGDTMVVL